MSVHTRSQKLAQAAYGRISAYGKGPSDDFVSFAKRFPALIHTCGLAQAIAFAQAKGTKEKDAEKLYLKDLSAVLQTAGHGIASEESLAKASRETPLSDYLRLSRDALQAAGWLKRYVEAVRED